MPRSRGSDMPQRPSPLGPAQFRTSSSESDAPRCRSITDRSLKLYDRQSPRNGQTGSVNQKKLSSRIADLETQLGQAQEELKKLKEQLAQEQLEKKTMEPAVPEQAIMQEKLSLPTETEESNKDGNNAFELHDDNQQATDVFEVPIEKVAEPKVETNQLIDQEDYKMEPVSISSESPVITKQEKSSIDKLDQKNDEINLLKAKYQSDQKNDEINLLKAKLEEKEKEVVAFCEENDNLKSQIKEAAQKISAAQIKDEEITMRMAQLEKELEASRGNTSQLNGKLRAVEGSKDSLETEMKKLRVQTEQWRKAADAAAAVLAGGMDVNGIGISQRSVSMDKHFGETFEQSAGPCAGFLGSPVLDDDDATGDVFATGKRKSSGIKMFGDLWKKKGQK